MKTVSVRNLGAQHTAVSYDGVCLSNLQAGQIDISRYSADGLASLSMAVGQDDDIMSTARHKASGALISMVTRRDERISAKIRTGSFGLVTPSFEIYRKVAGSGTSATWMGAKASWLRADGIYPFTLYNGIETSRQRRYNSDVHSLTGELNMRHTSAGGGTFDSKLYYFNSERGLPGGVIYYNTHAEERLWDENVMWQNSYDRKLSETVDLRTHLKYTFGRNKYHDENVKYTGGEYEERARQNEYYGSGTIGWKPLGWLHLSLAEDLAYNTLRTSIYADDDPSRFSSLTAVSAKASAGRLAVSASAVATIVREYVKGGDKPDDKDKLAKMVAASVRLFPEEMLYLRAMYKETFRVPTFNDMYYRQMGTRNLRPEYAREWSAGLTWTARPAGMLKLLSLSADAYYNDVEDKIVAFPTTYVWKMANFGKVKMTGVDITAKLSVMPFSGITGKIGRTTVDMAVAYSLCDARDRTDESSSYYDYQLPYTPRHSGSFSAVLKTPWVSLGYMVVGCGERYSMMIHDEEYRLKKYFDHSLTLTKEMKAGRRGIIFAQAKICNITDWQYEIVQYYPMPGRHWMISLGYRM